MIRDGLIVGINCKESELRLLKETDLIIKKIVDDCKSIELSKQHVKVLSKEEDVNLTKYKCKKCQYEYYPDKGRTRQNHKRLKTPAIEEAAAIMHNDNIQLNENMNADMELNKLKQAVEAVKKEILKPDKIKRKSWITTEILNLMEERRQNKGNPTEYKRIQWIIKHEIRKAKEKELQEKCREIEHHQNMHVDLFTGKSEK
ncbi:unnamed protein product [Ceutorhynchus assimilis]|uniref:Uncharacterized protein n=1 Tax=Ceutorhynchus assimilis TaxID=467358 RepID=A0A9N9MU38_9CUCU|nr:unnamed protein product [Ceutorhynchus assimilis]